MQSEFEKMMKRLRVTPMPKLLPAPERLRQNAATLDLTSPQKVEVRGMDQTRAVVEQQLAKIKQLKVNLLKALGWERDVEEEMDRLGTPDERRLLMKELKTETDKVYAFLKECYAESDPIFRTAIAATLIKFFLQKTCRSLEDYHRAAYQLRSRGLMEHAKSDDPEAILIGYEHLKCINCATMERSEDDEIRRIAAAFSQRMQDEWNRRSRELQAQGTITLDQLRDGVPGRCYLNVDKEVVRRKDNDSKETTHWRFGGQVLVESVGGKVSLIDGVGGAPFTRWRDYALGKKMRLTLGEVNARYVPGRGESFPKVVKAIRRDMGLSEELAEEYLGKLQTFWHLIRRAVKAANREQEVRVGNSD